MDGSIFISGKHTDKDVYAGEYNQYKDVGSYVKELQSILKDGLWESYFNIDETGDSGLSGLSDAQINQELEKRMHDSTVTIVLISPNMKEDGLDERQQWIPQEVAYSLSTKRRAYDYPNAMMAIVLPDAKNSYDYFLNPHEQEDCDATKLNRDILFPIMACNMLNGKELEHTPCVVCPPSDLVYADDSSYIDPIKWSDITGRFVVDEPEKTASEWRRNEIRNEKRRYALDGNIGAAIRRQSNREYYEIYTKLQ